MSTVTTTPGTTEQFTAEAYAERLFNAVLAAQEVQAAYLGDRLGWYRALAAGEPLTSAELAERTGTAERYAREWLEHQAVCGVLVVEDQSKPACERRFSLPPGHAEVLTDELSPNHVLPFARFVVGLGKHLDAMLSAYRGGHGVSWAELGDDPREAQGAANRPMFLGALGSEYLPQVPDVHAALQAGGRVADIGCGLGWSSIGIARAYPETSVDGLDLDAPSVEAASRNAAEAGVGDRVRFSVADAGAVAEREPYDLVIACECIHDLSDPVSVLATMRALAGDRGAVVVMDERVAEKFTAPGDEVERLMYGFSITCCLADGLSAPGGVGTGTVMRPSTLEAYARDAGFAGIEVLPIEDDFFRFYRLA